MADDDVQQMNPAAPQDGQLAPWLSDFRDNVGASDLDPAIVAIQQYTNASKVADYNRAEGEDFIGGMAAVKNGLLNVVEKDPTAADAAMDVAHHVVTNGLNFAGVPDEQYDQTHADITGHLQQNIAHAAVQRMAEIDSGAATKMLDKYSEHFSDEDRTATESYIAAMDMARGVDHSAQIDQMRAQKAATSQASAYSYLDGLLDPRGETVRFPDGWMQNVVRDTNVSGADKQALFNVFTRLRTAGDAEQSDGFMVHDLVKSMATTVDPASRDRVLDQAGLGLRFADAHYLHGLALRSSPESASELTNLATTLDDARDQFTGRSGIENGAAGANAFNRFTNWLLPAYRQAGHLGLNPASDNYLLANASPATFKPTADDLPRSTGPRARSLGDIFGS